MKKKILIIAGRLTPAPGANVIIARNIIKELKNRHYEVSLISINQNEEISRISVYENYVHVYPVKSTMFARYLEMKRANKLSAADKVKYVFLLIARRIENIVFVLKFPNVDSSQSKAVFRTAEKLYKQEKYDCILSVFRPYSAVYAGIQMKKNHPEIISGAYYMDLISGSNKPELIPNSLYKKLCMKGDIKTFRALDFILMAKGGESIYKNKAYSGVNEKITYTDFPVFASGNDGKKQAESSGKIRFVYAGTLDRRYRSPEFMLNILKEAAQKTPGIVLDIYGRGDCYDIIDSYKNSAGFKIVEHGMAPHEQIMETMATADFLINISNKTQNIIQSKIFELFSTGKPIVNFISNPDDISRSYFDKYPAVLNIQEWGSLWEYSDKLNEFISLEAGKQYSAEEIKKNYFENTPEHFVDMLEKLIWEG